MGLAWSLSEGTWCGVSVAVARRLGMARTRLLEPWSGHWMITGVKSCRGGFSVTGCEETGSCGNNGGSKHTDVWTWIWLGPRGEEL